MGSRKYGDRSANMDAINKRLANKSHISESEVLTPGQVKRITGGVDFSKVQETLGSNVNILADDIQTQLGEEQSAWDKWGNFGMQVGAEVLGGTMEGIGYLGDMAGLVDTLDGDMNEFGNWFSDMGIALKGGSREEFPIFGAHDMGNAGYWLSNGVSIASTLSLMIPATGTIKGIGMLGKAVGLADKMGKATKATMGILGSAVVSRHMENMMEAKGTWEATRDEALNKGASLDVADKAAATAASNLYKVNYALIAQDIFQYALLAKGPKINQAVTSNRMANAVGQSKLKTMANVAYPYLTDAISEGLEEGAQFIFAEEAKYHALEDAGVIPKEDASDRYAAYGKNSELWTSMLFGALGSGVMQGASAGMKQTNIPIFGGNKQEQEYLEERIQHANESYTKITEASIKLQAAMKADDQGGILEAENELAFNAAYSAAALGNFDISMANVDQLIEEIKDGSTEEQYAPDFEKKLKSLQSDMKTVAGLYKQNSRKYNGATVRSITSRQFDNLRLGKDLQKREANTAKAKEEFPRYNNLSAQGQESFDIMAEMEAIKQAKVLADLQAETIGTEEAAANSELFKEELDINLKELLVQLKEIKTEQDYTEKGEGQGPQIAKRAKQVKQDKSILEGFVNNADKAVTAVRDEFLTHRRIDQNNKALALLTDKKGQRALEEQQANELKKVEDENKEILKERKKKKKNKRTDSITESTNKTDSNKAAKKEEVKDGKKTTPEASPQKAKDVAKKPAKVPGLAGLTDAQLNRSAEIAETEEDLIAINGEIKRRADEKLEGKKKSGEKFEQKVAEQAGIIAINSAENSPTPENKEVFIAPEKFNAVAETGYALAWKSTTTADEVEMESDFIDPEMAKLITDYFEDVDISLKDHSLEFFIDEALLKEASTYKTSDPLREISDKLAKGESIGNLIGMLPVQAYLVDGDGNRVNISGRDLQVPIHDITFDGWNKLDPDKQDAAISEVVALKTAILENKGTNLVAPIEDQRGGVPNNTDVFLNASEALGIMAEDMVLVMGSKALPGTASGQYVDSSKEPVGNLEQLESASPGAVYASVKRPNGQMFPVRLWVSKLEEQEAELVYQLYALTMQDPDSYRSTLNKHPALLKLMQNSNDTRVSGLLGLINTKKTTIQDLLSMVVYEGPHTKTMGAGTLYSTKGMVKVGATPFNKEMFLTADGKARFKEALSNKMRQIPNELIGDKAFKEYLIDNELLTANFEPGQANFIQPTVVFGTPKTPANKEAATKPAAKPVLDERADTKADTETKKDDIEARREGELKDVKDLPSQAQGWLDSAKHDAVALTTSKDLEDLKDYIEYNGIDSVVEQAERSLTAYDTDKFPSIRKFSIKEVLEHVVNGTGLDGRVKDVSKIAEINAKYDAELATLEAKPAAQPTAAVEEVAGEQLDLFGQGSQNTASANKATELGNREEAIPKNGASINAVIVEAETSGTRISVTEKIKDKKAIQDMKDKLAAKLKPKKKEAPAPSKQEGETYDSDELDPFANKTRDIKDPSKPLTMAEVNKVAAIVPNEVSIEMTEDYITLLSGGRAAVGLFTSGLITLSAKAKSGDAYHEAFHAVFRTSLSTAKQAELLQEAKDTFLGPIEQDLKLIQAEHSISREAAIELFYEEQLADEFALYSENPQAYTYGPKSAKVKGLFARIAEWIKSFTNKPQNYKAVFGDILNGNFRSDKNVDAYIAAGTVASINNKTKKPC
tara:strand:- start:20671 stop:25809 length:5139 start_codon:yes stop_codon:yes gene_type:complete